MATTGTSTRRERFDGLTPARSMGKVTATMPAVLATDVETVTVHDSDVTKDQIIFASIQNTPDTGLSIMKIAVSDRQLIFTLRNNGPTASGGGTLTIGYMGV